MCTLSRCFAMPTSDAAQDRFRQEIAKLNKRVRDYNLNCPASAQMVPFDTVEEVHGVCKHLKSSTMTAAGETFCRQVRKAKREAERHHAEVCLTDFAIPGSRVRGFYLHPGCSAAAAICRHKKSMELCVHDISRHQLNRSTGVANHSVKRSLLQQARPSQVRWIPGMERACKGSGLQFGLLR